MLAVRKQNEHIAKSDWLILSLTSIHIVEVEYVSYYIPKSLLQLPRKKLASFSAESHNLQTSAWREICGFSLSLALALGLV